MNKFKISVIIPAFNEAETIGTLVETIHQENPSYQIIVIDDGSKDDTARIAEEAGATVFSHPYNIGNGAAVKKGIRVADGDILVFMDADGQHTPEEIEKLIEFFPEYDMVVGARTGRGQQASFGRSIGNNFYNKLASYVTKFEVEDLTSGFRAIKAEVAENLLYLLPNTYSYPTTSTLCVLRSGLSVKYVPIEIQKRSTGKSGISLFKDGIRFFMIITKICTLFSPLRVFLPISALTFLLGLLNYIHTFILGGRFTNMSMLLFSTSVIIFMLGLISEQITMMRMEKNEGALIEFISRKNETANAKDNQENQLR
ncbi:MAG: glycosyltransferase family 2 protein [Desulfobacterales bacterium]|nr:glycosyltransferase family 2 protein [Desulfobacterales bacterium]